MFQFFQMMQSMSGMGAMPGFDPAAMPFQPAAAPPADADKGLDAGIVRPATFGSLLREQVALPTGTILDRLCLQADGTSLGGLPKGTTIAFAGPPGKGKTRTALATLARVAASGIRSRFVVAEEGFRDDADSGRDDLCSRLVKIGMAVTGLDEAAFRAGPLENIWVVESQYHKDQSWDDFIARYRYLVEKAGVRFVVVNSLNMLDPSRARTADNLAALKTYNHEHGVTALCIGQIRDTGQPVGGEALMHTADVVFLLEEVGLASKEMAELWGGRYRDRIDTVAAVKSVTTRTLPHAVRVDREAESGALILHAAHPNDVYPVP